MDLNKLIDNRSVFTVRPFHMMDRHGADVVAVVAKVTWDISPQGEVLLASPQRAIRVHHRAVSEESTSSVLLPSDAVEEKPGTDVVMRCTAHPPVGKPVKETDVNLFVDRKGEPLEKKIRVFGPRVFTKGVKGIKPGPAGNLTPTPVIYENAAGGVEIQGDDWLMDESNPAGVGVARDPATLVGTRAPQLESLNGTGIAGFGPIPEGWKPRSDFDGTMDDAWAKTRAPLRAKDFDPRGNCFANPDLWSERPLEGTERVEVRGATPSGLWRFQLPEYAPRFESVQDGEKKRHETHLDTFLIDAEEGVVELCWRIRVKVPRKAQRIEKIIIWEQNELPKAMRDHAAAQLEADQEETDE